MANSFFFYDLETSGLNPREARIMQFAGQRTDMDLQPVGEPFDVMIRMTADVVPDPDSVLVTGITPQATLADGVTEAEFLKMFYDEVVRPGTIFVGYNTVRFDDEFMRYLHYRNFYDPYEWQWCDDCSRWDLLDVVRMTRALRPEGIQWPFNKDGSATNRLELLTKLNGLSHEQAHDALNDVQATIAIAKLIRSKQPKLFNFLLEARGKKAVDALVCESNKPFVYACGRYPAMTQKTTVAVRLASHPKRQGCLVYDLRYDPTEFLELSSDELVQRMQYSRDEKAPPRLPVKLLQFNRCPAVAPLSVLDGASQERIQLDKETVQKHVRLLQAASEWPAKVVRALELHDKQQQERWSADDVAKAATSSDIDSVHAHSVDSLLYGGFLGSDDKKIGQAIRQAKPMELSNFSDALRDKRLKHLLPLYKARNFPESLTTEERLEWEEFVRVRLLGDGSGNVDNSRLGRYFARLQELADIKDDTKFGSDKAFLLEELQLYGQSVMPIESD